MKALAALLVATTAAACGSSAPLAPVDAAPGASIDVPRVGTGCGKPLPADQVMTVPGTPKGYSQYRVIGTGVNLVDSIPAKAGLRTFWVRVPADYDPNRRYRVVYVGQGCGAPGEANSSTYQLFNEQTGGTEKAIYVAVDIPWDMTDTGCYDTNSGPRSQEWEAFELFHSFVDTNYCVDNDNVFVAGIDSGGTLANMWGCYFAGDGDHPWNGNPSGTATDGGTPAPRRFAPRYHIRGQASTYGGDPANNPPCNGPVAALWIEDTSAGPDSSYPRSKAALARVLEMNGCAGSTDTLPWHPELSSICVRYTACPAAYPVVFCADGLGRFTDRRNLAVPAFTLFFNEASGAAARDAGAD